MDETSRQKRKEEAEKRMTIGRISSKKEAEKIIAKNHKWLYGVFSLLTVFTAIMTLVSFHYLYFLGFILSILTIYLSYYGQHKKSRLSAILLAFISAPNFLVFTAIQFIFDPFLPELGYYMGDSLYSGRGALLGIMVASLWLTAQTSNAIFAWNKLPEVEDPLLKERPEKEFRKNRTPSRQTLNSLFLTITIIAAFIVTVWVGFQFIE